MKQTTEIAIDENVICDTTFLGLIKINGDDAASFLQGQFSNDVDQLNDNNSQLNSYNSPKGRMYASFRLFKKGNNFFMLLPREIIESVAKRLKMFVMRSNVTIEDLSNNWKSIGLSGATINQQVTQFPKNVDATLHDENFSYLRIPGIANRLLVIGSGEKVDQLKNELSKTLTLSDSNHWKRLDIHAGIPNIYPATQESFVAQMVNLPQVNGVSFTKGCYPGQEVVARMHYLGKLKKRMYRIIIDHQTSPVSGDNLFLAESVNKQSIGQIVDAQLNDDGGVDALAVIQTSVTDKGKIHVFDVEGPLASLADLPYQFEESAK